MNVPDKKERELNKILQAAFGRAKCDTKTGEGGAQAGRTTDDSHVAKASFTTEGGYPTSKVVA